MVGTGNIDTLKPIKKGERRGGRKAGTPNKTTQILKDALLDAAAAIGFPEEITLLDDDGKPTEITVYRPRPPAADEPLPASRQKSQSLGRTQEILSI